MQKQKYLLLLEMVGILGKFSQNFLNIYNLINCASNEMVNIYFR